MAKKKISEAEFERKIDRIMSHAQFQTLQEKSIFKNQEGKYHLFNRYFIEKQDENNVVVTLFNGDTVNSFFNMKSAVCWCIFDRRGIFATANRLVVLDNKISGLEVSIAIHKRMYDKAKDTDTKLIYLAKLNEEKLRKRDMSNELSRYLTDSDNWQRKQFKLKTEH